MFLFIVYFIVKYCTKCTNCSNRAKDPELIARQALDGTNRYRASKAGNISGPFQQIKLTHSEGPEQNPMNVDLFLVPKMLTPPMPTEKTWVISLCRVEGLPPLRWNNGIARIAREHAEQMASGAAPFSPIAATASTGFVPKWVFLTMVDLPGFTNKQYENYGENYHHIGFTRNGAINLNIRQAERNKCGTWRSLKKMRQVFEIWWPASFALLGHDGVDQRFRAYPVAYQSAAENLVGVPRSVRCPGASERKGLSKHDCTATWSANAMILESLADAPCSAFQAWHVGYWLADEIMKFFVFKHFKLPLSVICCPNCGWTL